jgi:hypothetical protein
VRNINWIILIITALVFSSCNTNQETTATISIISVTPDSGLTDATATQFTVVVDFTLTGSAQGEINIGFNNGSSINSYIMISDKIVSDGSGSETFIITTDTKDWGVSGDFEVYVNIVEFPHESTYSPIDSDRHILTFL